MMQQYRSLTLRGVVLMTSRLQPAGSGEERLTVCETKFVTKLSNLVRLEQIKGASIGINRKSDAKDSYDKAEIFELEALMKSLLEKLNVVEMSNKNQVVNLDGEDDSVVCCVEEKCTVHLILVRMIAVDTWISRCRFEAQIQEVLVESAVPGQRCLLETVEGADEAADIVWML